MKTLTEFQAVQLKNAAKVKQELVAAGKTPEELPQAMGEALKMEGDKLNFLLNALDLTLQKTNDLKRVVVMTLNEGETAPSNAQKKGDHYYFVEFYPPLPGAHPPRGRQGQGDRDQRGGRGGPGGRGKGRGDRDKGKGGGRGDQNFGDKRNRQPRNAPTGQAKPVIIPKT